MEFSSLVFQALLSSLYSPAAPNHRIAPVGMRAPADSIDLSPQPFLVLGAGGDDHETAVRGRPRKGRPRHGQVAGFLIGPCAVAGLGPLLLQVEGQYVPWTERAVIVVVVVAVIRCRRCFVYYSVSLGGMECFLFSTLSNLPAGLCPA